MLGYTLLYSAVDLTMHSTSLRDRGKEGLKALVSGHRYVIIISKFFVIFVNEIRLQNGRLHQIGRTTSAAF